MSVHSDSFPSGEAEKGDLFMEKVRKDVFLASSLVRRARVVLQRCFVSVQDCYHIGEICLVLEIRLLI